MIASLPMYQHAELAGAHGRYWELIRDGLASQRIASPANLSQHADEFETWLDPTLVLSQTCGMPYRSDLHGHVALVGTPDYGIAGCEPGFYRSLFVVRANDRRDRVEDFAHAVFAYNQSSSNSGVSAPYDHVVAKGFWFERRLRSGAHVESARAVASGRADIASIDAVSWRMIERYEPVATDLTVIDATEPGPGLPYITSLGTDRAVVFRCVSDAIDKLGPTDRDALGITSLVYLAPNMYLTVQSPPDDVMAALSHDSHRGLA